MDRQYWQQSTRSGSSEGSGSPVKQENANSQSTSRSGPTAGKAKAKKASGEKRKKTPKACLNCQKAHLTCDDARPCTRCVKKGLQDACVEGLRKKAKYLMDEDEIESGTSAAPMPPPPAPVRSISDRSNSNIPISLSPDQLGDFPPLASSSNKLPYLPSVEQNTRPYGQGSWSMRPPASHNMPHLPTVPSNDTLYNASKSEMDPVFFDMNNLDPSHPFTSAQANMEYEFLGSLFGIPSPYNAAGPSPTTSGDASMPSPNNGFYNPPGSDFLSMLDSSWPANSGSQNPMLSSNEPLPGFDDPSPSSQSYASSAIPVHPNFPSEPRRGSETPSGGQQGSSTADPTMFTRWAGGDGGEAPRGDTITASHATLTTMTPTEVYRNVSKSYDYTEGYHFLMKYLTNTFSQTDVLRVVKALAQFRPSLIALQMSLTENDEIFLERSFQRTLIELEKLVSFSGTPTAAWRRTGELCLVSPEFCRLTGRSKGELLGKKTFVYELFDQQSVVSYWEGFSVHAFENTTQHFFMRSVIMLPDQKPLPCTCCFTIRRDVFDLPSVVIGQYIPIPTERRE